jgi:K+-transporting ATPase ATPase B chain
VIAIKSRQTGEFIPIKGITELELAQAARVSSLEDETPEGRRIVALAKQYFGVDDEELIKLDETFVVFTEKTKMSGINYKGNEIRKGAADSIEAYILEKEGNYPEECSQIVKRIIGEGGTPLVVARNENVLGVVYLKDVAK